MSTSTSVLDQAWELHPQVAVRPESFGALLYHFGTRRLSFLKDRRLPLIIDRLGQEPTARDALARAGVPDTELPRFERALASLVSSDVLRERTS